MHWEDKEFLSSLQQQKYKPFPSSLEYLELFNCVQTIVILMCKQISSVSFKNKITNELLTYKLYV